MTETTAPASGEDLRAPHVNDHIDTAATAGQGASAAAHEPQTRTTPAANNNNSSPSQPAAYPIPVMAPLTRVLQLEDAFVTGHIKEIHQGMEREAKDTLWAPQREYEIRQRIAATLKPNEATLDVVECRSTACEIQATVSTNAIQRWNEAMEPFLKHQSARYSVVRFSLPNRDTSMTSVFTVVGREAEPER